MMSGLYGLQGTLSSGGGGIVNPIPNVEYLKIMSKPSVSNHQVIISRWSRPPLDYLKINVGGAWNKNSEAGSAVIVQQGNLLMCSLPSRWRRWLPVLGLSWWFSRSSQL
ncbi:hypothetical protein D8674_035956 [Pyrus ussuriensis x Pyrus communis]|uniref:Uncharacterized protein n=1 Tax=Pyrus ussuriensis x Pyrus communis TaxID=2448454 RepID=A0A5N5GK45_9ROSA|nr:hypothetical protein D8674_035956 [Pyrus ussuriensis x Pyrus communis]